MNLNLQSNAGGVVEVAVAGPVTQAQVSVVDDPLVNLAGAEVYGRQILFDLRDTELIDTSGISWLLKNHRRAREGGGRLVLHSLPPVVDNVLKVLRMNQVFEIAADRTEALSLLEGVQG
jgi:anti-anti-sigma factor